MGATVLVVFTQEARWLRFAVILGLWSALIAAFAMAWSRHDARTADLRAEEIEQTYELELHREISARREYEVGVSEAAREDAENRHREELTGLREQLDRLNNTLSELLDGNLVCQRLTLPAESTRIRRVGDGMARLSEASGPVAEVETGTHSGPGVGVLVDMASDPEREADVIDAAADRSAVRHSHHAWSGDDDQDDPTPGRRRRAES